MKNGEMRIAVLSLNYNPINGAGSHQSLRLFLEYFSSQGHQVTLFTIFSDKNTLPATRPYKIIEKKLNGPFIEIQEKVAKLLTEEESNFDIYFISGPSTLWGAGMYRKNNGKNPVMIYVNNYSPAMWRLSLQESEYPLFYRIKRYFWEKTTGLNYAKYVDAFLYDSPIIKNIYEKFGYPKEKSKIMPEPMKIENNELSLKKSGDIFKMLYVGRFVREKGLDILLQTMNILKDNKNIHLDIVGDGPLKEELLEFITTNNLSENIKIYPWQPADKISEYYKMSDAFIHPCRWIEQFGRTVVEAMDFGLPVIVTENTGASWIVGDSGLTFKNGDPTDLAKTILKISGDSKFRNTLSEKAIKKALDFDYKKTVPLLEQFSKDLIAGKKPETLKIF